MSGFLESFSGSMRDVAGEQDRMSAASTSSAPSPNAPGDPESDGPPRRTVSAAAMAIADQIMGLEAAVAATGSHPQLRGGDGELYTIESSLVLGRRTADDGVTIADGRVSRSHARVSVATDKLVVEDLGSSNGTFVVRSGDVMRVGTEPVGLRVGDRIETIDHLLLAEVVEAEAP